ncbi:hypothetical protein ACLMJK_000759 [Lecanora helva]
MQDTSLLRRPPGLEPSPTSSAPSVRIPSLATRRAACTHVTMVRKYGDFRCDVCNQTSELGWVYSCSQDEHHAEAMEGVEQQHEEFANHEQGTEINTHAHHDENINDKDHHFVVPSPELSPSVQKAIKEGHYTPEQVVILRAQKQNLVNFAKDAIERFEGSQRIASESVDVSQGLPSQSANDVEDTSVIESAKSIPAPAVAKLKMFPQCEFQACQCCRPIYRDRTWLCFEDVFAMDPSTVAQALINDENRPFPHVSVLERIGLRFPKRRPHLRRISRSAFFSTEGRRPRSRLFHRPFPASTDSGDIADENSESDSKSFRESMKRAFKGMLANRQQASRPSRKRKTKESTTTDEDAAEFDMGLWKQMNDDLLREASSVPLPPLARDSIDGLGVEGKSDVAIAVTEEAAELNAGDVILSD